MAAVHPVTHKIVSQRHGFREVTARSGQAEMLLEGSVSQLPRQLTHWPLNRLEALLSFGRNEVFHGPH